MYELHYSYSAISEALDVNVKTVDSIITTYRNERRTDKLPCRQLPVTADEVRLITTAQRNEHSLTLSDITNRLVNNGFRRLHRSTVCRVLKRQGFSTKQLTVECAAKQSARVKQDRIEYLAWAVNNLTPQNTIFLDESPWSEVMHPNRVRSEIGTPAVKRTTKTKAANISMIAAISPAYGPIGYVAHKTKIRPRGAGKEFRIGTTAEMFCVFLRSVANRLKRDYPQQEFYFILGNASDEAATISASSRHTHRASTPSNAFSKWKAEGRRTEINSEEEVYQHMASGFETITTQDIGFSIQFGNPRPPS
jgi:transposase